MTWIKPLAILASLALIPVSAHADERKPGRVEFAVFRNGEAFGKQSVTVTSADGHVIAESAADLKVSLGPITVFHYKQTCSETWRETQLAQLTCSTLKDGKTTRVTGAPTGQAINVTTGKAAQAFPMQSLPTAWWSRPPAGSYEMINTETGKALAVTVTRIGRETISPGGTKIEAEHVRVSGSLTVDLWYDDVGHWVDCAFSMGDQHMTYKLLTPPASAPS